MSILVGTDFSPAALSTGIVAAELARRRGDELVLVHVVDGPLLPPPGGDHERIAEEARRLSAHGCRVRTVLERDGNRGKRLADIAEREDAALIVVGAQGGGLRSPLGTVATGTIRNTARPVLVVRKPEGLWERDSGRVRALVPLALDGTDVGVLEALKLVAGSGDLDADFVHYRPVPTPRDEPRTRIGDERALRSYFGELPPGIAVRHVDERDGFGRLDGHVTDLAVERGADLIVCGSHHRHGLERVRIGSTAEGLVLHAPVSVLVARAPQQLDDRRAPAAPLL